MRRGAARWICAMASAVVLGGLPGMAERAAGAGDAGADVLKALQGTWSGKRYSVGAGEDESDGVALRLQFEGAHVKATRVPRGAIGEGDIKIAGDGRAVDAVGATGGYRGKTYTGILKIEGDTLYWCTSSGGASGARPSEFRAHAAKGSFLIIVRRERS